jgi:hypothetical protein
MNVVFPDPLGPSRSRFRGLDVASGFLASHEGKENNVLHISNLFPCSVSVIEKMVDCTKDPSLMANGCGLLNTFW